MVDLESVLAQKTDSVSLLYQFTLANHKRIQNLRRKRVLTVTAYSPRRGETDSTPFRTASNRKVRRGIVAVSRDLFDNGWVFGKKVYIKNYGIYTIDDLMASFKRNQVDIFMFETRKALHFGKKKLEVYLLDVEPAHATKTSSLESDSQQLQ